MTDLPSQYDDALRKLLRDALPGARVREGVSYELPGVWYIHAETPGLGTTTIRLHEQVVRHVPMEVTLDAMRTLPALIQGLPSPTVTVVQEEGRVRFEVDSNR